MIRKLLCWLGWHEWVLACAKYCNIVWKCNPNCQTCQARKEVCIHCGKVRDD